MADDQVAPEFYPKQAVEIEVSDGMLAGVYSTKIANLNDTALLLDVPQIGNLFLPLKINQQLVVRYVVESWAYEMPVSILARRDNLETPLMLVPRPKLANRRMLRKYFRVEAGIDASVFLIADLSEYGREKFADNELTPSVIIDISGGGCRLRAPLHLPTEGKRYAILWFTLPLIHKSFYNMLARVQSVVDEAREKILILEFAGLSESERDDIVQYCVRRQAAAKKADTEIGAAGS